MKAELTQAQDQLLSYWVMEAMPTTAKEDVGDLIRTFTLEVKTLSDKEARALLEAEINAI